jgi:hypothetical protein
METTIDTPATLSRGEGYLIFVGYLQLVAGVLTMLFSGMAVVLAMFAADSSWMNPITVARSFGPAEAGFFVRLIGAYMALQFAFGWIFGLLLIVGGALCLKKRGRRFVTISAIINLFNFPHGTTVAILVLHGIARPGISGAFRDE